MLKIRSSNRLEQLADALSRELLAHPLPPLTPEIVVVQSLGMRRWLSFALAEKMGVAMNISFPFPAHVVERAFLAILPQTPVSPVFRREVLPWRIHSLLPAVWDQPEFEELRRYGGNDPLKRWHLAGQIASVFDRYLAYRPTLLRKWDRGENDPGHPWQSQLWRKIEAAHPAALAERLANAPESANSNLPARISVFGVSTLPPFYVELLGELGRRTDVHLYLLAPTHEYWGDLRSDKEIRRYHRWCERRNRSVAAEHFSEGHPLLASLGKVGRDFHEAVLDLTPGEETAEFEKPEGDHLLSKLQRSILNLDSPDTEDDRVIIHPLDPSIQVHNCHSPLRELEVLHDRLLDLFERNPDLEPRDVLVTMPDVTAYAPLIDAVFGAPESEAVRFPYSIADRDMRSQNAVTDAFLRLMELTESRFTSTDVIALLECPPVAARFELSDADLPSLRRWTAESGVRWGLDANHRERLGFPSWGENTWQFGLNRLLLGAALPANDTALFEGILPFGDAEGSQAEILGRFATVCATIFPLAERFAAHARKSKDWMQVLREALAELCASDGDFADAWRETAAALEAFENSAELAGNDEELPFSVVRDFLERAFAESDRENEFLRGGITFCSLKPMRSIPHRIVAMLGMNDGAFPRTSRPPSFDLTATHPQAGDRTIRDDDRYLFLETILSARDVLYLSHCGQSAKDDSLSPPSVLVVELLDYVERVYRLPEEAPVREHLTYRHALQPFHAGYFRGNGRMFSYSGICAEAARVASGMRNDPPPFISIAKREVPQEGELTLDLLSSFLVHPTKFFAQEGLSMQLPYKAESLQDVEPIAFDGLESYSLRQDLVEIALEGENPQAHLAATKASGALPQGLAGDLAFGEAVRRARSIADEANTHAPGAASPPRVAELIIGNWRLRGHILGDRGGLLLRVRPADIAPKDLLRAWCAHLFACAAEPKSTHRTLIVGNDESQVLSFVPNAVAELERLVNWFAEGSTRPLPFFPDSSYAFARATLKPGRGTTTPLEAAEKKWRGSANDQFGRAEAEDEWNAIVWRPPAEPLLDEFASLSCEVFRPLFEHLGNGEE